MSVDGAVVMYFIAMQLDVISPRVPDVAWRAKSRQTLMHETLKKVNR